MIYITYIFNSLYILFPSLILQSNNFVPQAVGTRIADLRVTHDTFRSACDKVMEESGTGDTAPMEQIAKIEVAWNNLVTKYDIISEKVVAVEKPSLLFYNEEREFGEWLHEAESRLDSLKKTPSVLKEAKEFENETKV